MGDNSVGALVPSVTRPSASMAVPVVSSSEMTDTAVAEKGKGDRGGGEAAAEEGEVGKGGGEEEVLCPICMGMMKDAFLTACGHSFCYMCIVTHLQNKNDCPCCAHYLTKNHIYPNFLLNKVSNSLFFSYLKTAIFKDFLAHPDLLAAITSAISEVSQTRSALRTLGARGEGGEGGGGEERGEERDRRDRLEREGGRERREIGWRRKRDRLEREGGRGRRGIGWRDVQGTREGEGGEGGGG